MKKFYLFILLLALVLPGCAVLETIPFLSPQEVSLPAVETTAEMPAAESPSLTETAEIGSSPTAELVESTPESTAVPSDTIVPTAAPTVLEPTITPTETTIVYRVQEGSPVSGPNLFHPELGCNWMGVAGQVLNEDGSPALNLVVEVGGILLGTPVERLALTGSAPSYGEGGYEIKLADGPIASDETLWLQVFDLEDRPVSEKLTFSTYSGCEQNLIIINLQRDLEYRNYLPGVDR